MSCDAGEAMEALVNEAPLILQPFWHCFTYVRGTSTLPGEPPMPVGTEI